MIRYCPVCNEPVGVNANGLIHLHVIDEKMCMGSGTPR